VKRIAAALLTAVILLLPTAAYAQYEDRPAFSDDSGAHLEPSCTDCYTMQDYQQDHPYSSGPHEDQPVWW
jgi:hypothetical protein